jgi:hypothetical protein
VSLHHIQSLSHIQTHPKRFVSLIPFPLHRFFTSIQETSQVLQEVSDNVTVTWQCFGCHFWRGRKGVAIGEQKIAGFRIWHPSQIIPTAMYTNYIPFKSTPFIKSIQIHASKSVFPPHVRSSLPSLSLAMTAPIAVTLSHPCHHP